MEHAALTRIWRIARWALVALVLAAIVRRALQVLKGGPSLHNVPFHEWYGDWREVALVTAIFLAFLLGFTWPRRRVEWRSAGLYAAFLISLFTEMFGVPLTIYLIAPALGLPATTFGMNESHLWAFALHRLGLLPLRWGVFVVMAISTVLIVAGLGLLMVGWASMGTMRELIVAATLALGLFVAVGVAGGDATRDLFDLMVIDRVWEPSPAPDVIFRTLDGREVRMGDLRGQLVLLGFFTTG